MEAIPNTQLRGARPAFTSIKPMIKIARKKAQFIIYYPTMLHMGLYEKDCLMFYIDRPNRCVTFKKVEYDPVAYQLSLQSINQNYLRFTNRALRDIISDVYGIEGDRDLYFYVSENPDAKGRYKLILHD